MGEDLRRKEGNRSLWGKGGKRSYKGKGEDLRWGLSGEKGG